MTDKELRKLSRAELLGLLIEVTEENERLTAELGQLRDGSDDTTDAQTRQEGDTSPRPASVPQEDVSAVLQSASDAASGFLKEAQDLANQIIERAERKAKEMTDEAQETVDRMIDEAQATVAEIETASLPATESLPPGGKVSAQLTDEGSTDEVEAPTEHDIVAELEHTVDRLFEEATLPEEEIVEEVAEIEEPISLPLGVESPGETDEVFSDEALPEEETEEPEEVIEPAEEVVTPEPDASTGSAAITEEVPPQEADEAEPSRPLTAIDMLRLMQQGKK